MRIDRAPQIQRRIQRSIYVFCLLFVFLPAIGFADETVILSNGKSVVLHDDFTWSYQSDAQKATFDYSTLSSDSLPTFLRQGIRADLETQRVAVEMYLQGWRYTMPQPKSAQARWGNTDRRTTWFYGYWFNSDTSQYSSIQPTKKQNGLYIGDNQNQKGYYRNGGSPPNPSQIDWLLSESGGVKPSDTTR